MTNKDISGTLDGAAGIGGLLYVKLNGAIYVPFYDAYGNVMEYRASDGSVAASYVYDAFGRTISQTGPLADVFRYRYSTKSFEREVGLYYYCKRFYLPELSRWLSRDPFGEAGGVNLYGFCCNNALMCFDLLGNAHFEVRALQGVGALLSYSCFASIIGVVPAAVLDLGLANKLNIEILHEHLFYDDGSNVGYHEGGTFEETAKGGYRRRDMREYDDCIMHEVEKLADPPPYSLLGWGAPKYNCQDYCDTLRMIYDRIKDWPEIKCKCKK